MTRRMLRVVSSPGSIEDLPAVLTVEEAAVALRIGRGTAYALARQWRQTNGRQGLPCIVLGRTLRVPREGLRRLLEASLALPGRAKMDTDGDAAPYAQVVHAYPEALAFLNRHGPEAVAVLDDLVAHADVRDGQLVVAASVRQLADRLVFTSKDTVNRRLRQLLAAGVITRLADHRADRFAVPVYVLHLDATGICRGTVPSRSA